VTLRGKTGANPCKASRTRLVKKGDTTVESKEGAKSGGVGGGGGRKRKKGFRESNDSKGSEEPQGGKQIRGTRSSVGADGGGETKKNPRGTDLQGKTVRRRKCSSFGNARRKKPLRSLKISRYQNRCNSVDRTYQGGGEEKKLKGCGRHFNRAPLLKINHLWERKNQKGGLYSACYGGLARRGELLGVEGKESLPGNISKRGSAPPEGRIKRVYSG